MSAMNVLVTGGAGFIGSHSTEALLADGAGVTVFDNFSSGKRDNLVAHERLTVIDGDIRDRAAVAAAMKGVTHVLHLAAQIFVRLSIEDPPLEDVMRTLFKDRAPAREPAPGAADAAREAR